MLCVAFGFWWVVFAAAAEGLVNYELMACGVVCGRFSAALYALRRRRCWRFNVVCGRGHFSIYCCYICDYSEELFVGLFG